MKTLKTMTVAELRRLLDDIAEEYSPDMPIAFGCNYGDYSNTTQVLPINNDVTMVALEESHYSQSGFAVDTEATEDLSGDLEEAMDAEGPQVVLMIGFEVA